MGNGAWLSLHGMYLRAHQLDNQHPVEQHHSEVPCEDGTDHAECSDAVLLPNSTSEVSRRYCYSQQNMAKEVREHF